MGLARRSVRRHGLGVPSRLDLRVHPSIKIPFAGFTSSQVRTHDRIADISYSQNRFASADLVQGWRCNADTSRSLNCECFRNLVCDGVAFGDASSIRLTFAMPKGKIAHL